MKKISDIQQLFPNKYKQKPKRLLAIFAHPDDESLRLAGILSKAYEEKLETYLICLTKGEIGVVEKRISKNKLKSLREKELQKASKILNITKTFILDFPDGELTNLQLELELALKRYIKRLKPGILITHDPSGMSGHPDHITSSLITYKILKEKGFKDIYLYFSVCGEEEKIIIKKLFKRRFNWKSMPTATHKFDFKKFIDKKVAACLFHKSQHLNKSKSVDLKTWYTLFNSEYLHKVNKHKKYNFKYLPFNTPYFNFQPSMDKIGYGDNK